MYVKSDSIQDNLSLEKLERYEEAISCYDKIMKIGPYVADDIYCDNIISENGCYEKKSECFEKLGRYEEALNIYYTRINELLIL